MESCGYVEPLDAEVASSLLRALNEAGLSLLHPTLARPSYSAIRQALKAIRLEVTWRTLGERISEACRGRAGILRFQLWVDPAASHDVICTASATRSGLACLAFSFDGLDGDEAQTVEEAVTSVRRRGELPTKVWVADYFGIDPPHVTPLVL